MVIKNLFDIKEALLKAPDELLSSLWMGLGESAEDEISVIAGEGDDRYEFPQVFDLIKNSYPELKEVLKFLENISKAQAIIDKKGESLSERLFEEELTSDFKF